MKTLRPALLLLALPVALVGAARSAAPLAGFEIQLPHEFAAGQPARASEVNANFGAIVGAVEQRADEVDASLDLLTTDVDSLLSRTGALETTVDDLPVPSQVIHVALAGAPFDSVSEALASIQDASATNRYLVQVAPGVYEETETAVVPSFVTLRGSGAASTVVRSAISGGVIGIATSTVFLEDGSAVCDLTIENTGASATSVALGGAALGRDTVVRNVVARANGNGGSGHFAMHVTESDVLVVDSVLEASGASLVNTAFGSTDSSGPFAQPLLRGCDLDGDGPVSGFGVQMTSTALQMDDCRVSGDLRAIFAGINGISTVRGSRIASLGLNPVYEQTGSATILSGNVFFVGGDPQGLASQFKYAWCIKSNFDVVANGTGSTIEP